jgi:hypothetical protein
VIKGEQITGRFVSLFTTVVDFAGILLLMVLFLGLPMLAIYCALHFMPKHW